MKLTLSDYDGEVYEVLDSTGKRIALFVEQNDALIFMAAKAVGNVEVDSKRLSQ